MKPVSADAPALLAQPSGPPQPRPRRREGTGVRTALVSFSVFIIALAGAFWLRDAAVPLRATQDNRAHQQHAVGTIKLPEGKLCRQMTIDNRTGQMVKHGLLPCDKSPVSDPKEELKDLQERQSGGRIDAIRNSFRSR
jgi:hypothetical protein